MSHPLRVMLVDDHALCRSGLTELLQHRAGMTVVGATGCLLYTSDAADE